MPIMIRTLNDAFAKMSGMPINSKGGKNVLKQAGIDTGSKQYQAVMRQMSAGIGAGVVYTNPQAIQNLMKNYDKNGDYINPVSGLTGLLVTDENIAQKHRIISIPESSREEMFELTKKEFIKFNGSLDGNTQRGDIYTNLYKKMPKNDRLAAGNTLRQYEKAYRKAFLEAARKVDPEWEIGKPVSSKVLESISREDVERNLVENSGDNIQRNINLKV